MCYGCIKKGKSIHLRKPLKETLLIGQKRQETESDSKSNQWGGRKQGIAYCSHFFSCINKKMVREVETLPV